MIGADDSHGCDGCYQSMAAHTTISCNKGKGQSPKLCSKHCSTYNVPSLQRYGWWAYVTSATAQFTCLQTPDIDRSFATAAALCALQSAVCCSSHPCSRIVSRYYRRLHYVRFECHG